MPEIEHGDKPLPRNGSDVYSLPATYEAVTGETIEAQQHNDPLEDLEQDMNTARPIVAGGTGASTAVGGHDAFSTKGSNVASAATCDIGAASGRYVHITGTTTITAFGTKTAGVVRILTFDGILTLTHHATSLILPTGANITTAAGDTAVMVSEGSGNWKCVAYSRANGTALALPAGPTITGPVTISTTDDGANGAIIDMTHVSASPAANDAIANIRAIGRDSAGNGEPYGLFQHFIVDPTSGSEDSKWTLGTVVAGTLATRAHFGAGAWMEGATGGDPGAGKINATGVQENGVALGYKLTSGTAQATTSGTSKEYTSIPSWVKRITWNLSGVSGNGSSIPIIQIGDSGGYETTGYLGATGTSTSGGVDASNNSTGFRVAATAAADKVLHGKIVLELLDAATNTWSCSVNIGESNAPASHSGGGSKALSAALDRTRITFVNGTDAFDAGSVNISYE